MPPIRSQSPANVTEQEGRILLAIQALKKQEFSSLREVARCFNIPRSTLQNRLRGLQTARFLAPARINRQRVKKNLFKNVFSLWIYTGFAVGLTATAKAITRNEYYPRRAFL
ncbi:Probable transposable element [Penicillium roqueforti FM164]|uniref:Probable transposable element n=1 Tax=Penicillium roqueforti (strain FM164) TaxID=1365484 RepID=W6QNF9_PENRF|nr:Probable transposable element [Penicillium roqueforti FM164]